MELPLLFKSSSTTQEEAQAVQLACALSSTLDLFQVHAESNNKTVIELSVSELDPPWDCQAIIYDILQARVRNNITFNWSPRKCNCVVHWVASINLKGSLLLDWIAHPSCELFILLSADIL
ncbi:hypothetical protein ACSBR2_001929 [Camellia fascicularis]